MAKYFALLGRRVHVEYRAGDVNLPASGMMAADSGRSIFLEERFEKSGHVSSFRWEIPYQHIVRILEFEETTSEARGDAENEKIDRAHLLPVRPPEVA